MLSSARPRSPLRSIPRAPRLRIAPVAAALALLLPSACGPEGAGPLASEASVTSAATDSSATEGATTTAGLTTGSAGEGADESESGTQGGQSASDTSEGPESGGATETDGGTATDEGTATDTGSATDGDPAPLILYLAPDGDDANDGLQQSSAVATLNRVHDLVIAHDPGRDVLVEIASGTYPRQTVTWTKTMPEHTITLRRADPRAPRPLFDGCDGSGCTHTFFILDHSDGEPTNLHFEYLQIERYRAAISLQGNRNDFARSNSHNRIYGCYFRRIGNKWNDHGGGESYAVIRLLNSDDNEIRNNHFVQCENASQPGLLHALYIAHNAERNLVVKNRFVTQSGDPIRVRDFSNDNRIADNRFVRSGAVAVFSDWYCTGDACTKDGPECPSWANEFRDNELDGDYACQPATTWHLFKGDDAPGCTAPPGAKRLATSGNTKTPVPCQGL